MDAKGELLTEVCNGALPAYEQAVVEAMERWKVKPASRGGKPVGSVVTCLIVFNPASAPLEGPDATPRLIGAVPVDDPAVTDDKAAPGRWPAVIWASVSLDAAGVPTGVTGVPEPVAAVLRRNVASWRFLPARRGGRPVAADVRVPFLTGISGPRSGGAPFKPVHMVHTVPPEYPLSMQMSGFRGEVLVSFVVDTEGRVRHPMVARSLNPAFDDAAIASVSQWRFEPATKGGVPVDARVNVPITFRLEESSEGGSSGYEIEPAKGAPAGAAAAFDVAPKPLGTVIPVYPYAALAQGATGSATIAFRVAADGRVAATMVVEASRPEFGAAATAAMELYVFEPALKGGRPVPATLKMKWVFDPDDVDPGVVSDEDQNALRIEHKHPERIVGARHLDRPLNPTSCPPPHFPTGLMGRVKRGEAIVTLLVDTRGRARLPRVDSATDPAFGWAAVQAAAAWRFDPPTKGGSTVMTRVRVPFEFTMDDGMPKAPGK